MRLAATNGDKALAELPEWCWDLGVILPTTEADGDTESGSGCWEFAFDVVCSATDGDTKGGSIGSTVDPACGGEHRCWVWQSWCCCCQWLLITRLDSTFGTISRNWSWWPHSSDTLLCCNTVFAVFCPFLSSFLTKAFSAAEEVQILCRYNKQQTKGWFIIWGKGLRCVTLWPEVHVKWIGQQKIDKNSIPALCRRPNHFTCTSHCNVT